MKKIILITPLTIIMGICSFTANLEAAGCSSHKNKNVKVECSLSDDNCDDNRLDKKLNKADV